MTHRGLFVYTALVVIASAAAYTSMMAATRAARRAQRRERAGRRCAKELPIQPTLKPGVDASLTSQSLPF